MRIAQVDGLLASGGHQNVALLEHEVGERLERLGAGEAADCAMGDLPVLQLLGVDAIWVVDGAVVFLDANAEAKKNFLKMFSLHRNPTKWRRPCASIDACADQHFLKIYPCNSPQKMRI